MGRYHEQMKGTAASFGARGVIYAQSLHFGVGDIGLWVLILIDLLRNPNRQNLGPRLAFGCQMPTRDVG